jgi:ABC-type branched-subunit amino acid transport system substrate-binding protein
MIRGVSSTKSRLGALGAATVVVVGAVACSSSGSTSNNGNSGATSNTVKEFTVGLLTDATGPAASGNKLSVNGVNAGKVYAARNGYKFRVVLADTQTNPAAVAAAAKKLVTQDHVDAVLSVSAITLLAAPYLTAHNVPVIGVGEDGPEWLTAKNMFSVFGALNTTKVATTFGEIAKGLGVTNLGALGYAISPVSAENTKGNAASAEAAGFTVGYLNANFPFGSTNVAPVAIAMKNGGVNGFTAATDPNTAFSLITALKQQGVNLKAAVLSTGYGSDLAQAGQGALNAAQNVYFVMTSEPFSANTAATKQFAADLKSAGVVTTQAAYSEYAGYLSVGLLVRALNGAGSNPTSAAIIKSLEGVHDWNGLGLMGDLKVDINNRTDFAAGPNNCAWIAQLEGTKYIPVKGMQPLCGKLIPGKTVSSSS